jgi:hypothetical protein
MGEQQHGWQATVRRAHRSILNSWHHRAVWAPGARKASVAVGRGRGAAAPRGVAAGIPSGHHNLRGTHPRGR